MPPSFFDTPSGDRIAFHRIAGASPGVMFLGGFMSDMTGTKAMALEQHCRERGRAFLRFDYQGHGASEGVFAEGTIGRWKRNALDMLDAETQGRQVIVGSSMGGWLALLLARERRERVAGLIGVAAAPDFTEDLLWARLSVDERRRIEMEGKIRVPSEYGDSPYTITRMLIEEARAHLVLRAPLPLFCPLRLLHGMRDADVPWTLALRLARHLEAADVQVTLMPKADHRISDPASLEALRRILDAIATTAM